MTSDKTPTSAHPPATTQDSTVVQKWIHSFIEKAIGEMNKDDNRKHIHSHVVVPLLHILYNELYPYIIFTLVVIVVTLVMCIVILFFVIMMHKKMEACLKMTVS
jgi:hypothetical protein